jgi:aspartate aminotransferase-like enzyme
MRDTLFKERLLCPGPTPIPQEALWGSIAENPYHRTESFYSIFSKVRDSLSYFFNGSMRPLLLTTSGTGGMEASVVNFTNEGDAVLVLEAGRFAERWTELLTQYGCNVDTVSVAWGQVPDPDVVQKKIASKNYKAIFMQGVETSTGVYLPVRELAQAIRKHSDALIVVDAISSLAAHEMKMSDWDIDVVIGGSQKGLGAAPGMAFIALSDRAKTRFTKRAKFYFDLATEWKCQDQGYSSWTCNTQIILSLYHALIDMDASRYQIALGRHRTCSLAVRAALQASGIELYVKEHFAYSVTPFLVPSPATPQAVTKELKSRYRIQLAGGQDQLKDSVLRIAHMGFFDPFDVLAAIGAVEVVMQQHGCSSVRVGEGVKRFLTVIPQLA